MIFLTGGTGLLGLHILDELRSRSLPVTALVRDEAGARSVAERGARPVTGTVENRDTWARLHDVSAIIHSAALIAGRYPWDRFEQVNVFATRLGAERARQLGVPLVHISSVAVYGRNYRPGTTVVESTPLHRSKRPISTPAPNAWRKRLSGTKRVEGSGRWHSVPASSTVKATGSFSPSS